MSGKKVKLYTEEFKKSSAQLAFSGDKSISQTAIDLGINPSTLHGWVTKYYPASKKSLTNNSSNDLSTEVKNLRRENIRLKQERDILKKAAAYFASEAL